MTVRVPVVPGANDDRESLTALADFVASHPRIRRVELLPYHPLGRTSTTPWMRLDEVREA